MKEHDDMSPKRLGDTIYIDVITRNSMGKKIHGDTTLKFYVASEAISSLTKVSPIGNGANNSETGVRIDLKILDDFSTGPPGVMQKRILMDGSSVNVKMSKDLEFEEMNVRFFTAEKCSKSKNYIAPLDSRIQKLSPVLNELIREAKSPAKIATIASARYNSVIGTMGLCPFEIWNNRGMLTGKPLSIEIETLVNMIKKSRKIAREAKDRNLRMGRVRMPIHFRPYTKGDLYDSDLESPIKLGDILLIEGDAAKNNLHPFFEVIATKEIPGGIDWENNLAATRKVGVRLLKPYVWNLDAIRAIVDGELVKDKTDRQEIRDKMVKVNVSLLLPECMQSRSEVYEFELWPFERRKI